MQRADLFMERVYSNFCFSAIDCLLLSLWLLGAGDRGKEASRAGLVPRLSTQRRLDFAAT
jgi:hypothetical protein